MAQNSFDKCQKTSDAYVRTGHALSLGCLHRYVGGMGSGHYLGNSVSILVALAKDVSSSLVQVRISIYNTIIYFCVLSKNILLVKKC